MAHPAGLRLRRGMLALSTAIAVGAALPANAQWEPPIDETSEQASVVSAAAAAPAGSAAEAIPDVPAPPSFDSPNAAPLTPPIASSAVYLDKATGRFSILAGGGNGLGMDAVDGEAAFKFRDVENLTILPSAGVLFLDGPNRTDLPPRLYAGQVEFRWFGQLAKPLFYELAFMPGLFTDGDNVGSDALRLQGRGVGYLAFSEQTQLALGLTYLDREDVPVLPIFGLLHAPSDDLKLELVFPRPRVLQRVSQHGDGETWAYVAGELGGGSWAIERRNGRDDIASYRDYRFLLGLEHRKPERWTATAEAGYVFGRELEYDSHRGDYDPDSTFLLRLALAH